MTRGENRKAWGQLRNGAPGFDLSTCARCGAKTRAGGECRGPAMANGRCKLHGGLSTGPKLSRVASGAGALQRFTVAMPAPARRRRPGANTGIFLGACGRGDGFDR